MANALYDTGRAAFLRGEVAWQTDAIKAVLVDMADYPGFSLTTNQYLSDIPAGARVATSANFTTKTTTAGVADADDPTFVGATGDLSEAVVIYKDTGTASTSQLIAYIDSATGLPVQPNTGDIRVIFDNGANRIFKL